MINPCRFGWLAALVTVSVAAVAPGQTTTITGTAGGADSWNIEDNWDNGVPTGAMNAVVSDGVTAQVLNATTPEYTGTLTLNADSTLLIGNVGGSQHAVQSPSGITMQEGASISVNINANITFPPIALAGNASLVTPFGASDWQTDTLSAITGPYTLTLSGFNGQTFILNAANTFTELVANGIDRWVLVANAPGALGAGDVTINPRTSDPRSAVLKIAAEDAMADTATLYLNGQGWNGSTKGAYAGTYTRLDMQANDTVAGLWIDGEEMPEGDYDNTYDWLAGPGILTVAAAAPGLMGDANRDGFVDDNDLSLLLANWGADTDWDHGEFSGAPPVDDNDLSLLLANWTGSPPSPLPVPEPASVAVLALGGLAALGRRRR